MLKLLLLLSLFISCQSAPKSPYPDHWWSEVDKSELAWWEISPHLGIKNKTVILSKRNELGLLSNFAPTPIDFEGKKYKTVEALWQSMKYPEGADDERSVHKVWPHNRSEVEQMDGFAAKEAGDYGSKVMQELDINWVSYKGKKITYRTTKRGEHYKIIRGAMEAKLAQNPKVREVLMKTKGLKLLPDHHVKATNPPAWQYYTIWEEIRAKLSESGEI